MNPLSHSNGRFPLPIRSTRLSRSPKFPDQARPTALHDFFPTATRPPRLLMTPPRLQPDNHPDLYLIIATPTRSLLDQLDLYSISIVQGSWDIHRIDVELIRYWSVYFFYPDQTRFLLDRKKTYERNFYEMPLMLCVRIDKWTESMLSITSSQECSIVQLVIPIVEFISFSI